jgi:DNA-directed RNA polymerase subunit M/transcription elongation factor TFIIS
MDAERATGIRDQHYDVVSVLYHALNEADVLQQYIDDAEEAGDEELAAFFRDVQKVDRERAERAKQLLRERTRRMITEDQAEVLRRTVVCPACAEAELLKFKPADKDGTEVTCLCCGTQWHRQLGIAT